MAGKPQTLATTSAFEILGPIMVGPSSSHTAGALRCASVAASLLEGTIASVRFTLWNSFAHTYRGHGTDRALVAGIMGFDTDDERIRDSFAIAQERGLSFTFDVAGDDGTLHPNTVDIDMTDDTGATAAVRGESLGGGRIRISRINGVGVDISGMYSTLFVAHRDAPGALAALTSLLAAEQVNIAFCRTYRTEAGGQAYSVFETDGAACDDVLPHVRALDAVDYATFIEVPGSASTLAPGVSTPELFDDGEQLLDACESLGLTIGAVMAVREANLIGEERCVASMARVLEVMRDETTAPLSNPQRSLGGFIGGEAKLMNATADGPVSAALLGSVQTAAVARAMAVLERSASMGVIVAAPTAGSAGVVPGCRSWMPCSAPPPWDSTSPPPPASPAPKAAARPRSAARRQWRPRRSCRCSAARPHARSMRPPSRCPTCSASYAIRSAVLWRCPARTATRSASQPRSRRRSSRSPACGASCRSTRWQRSCSPSATPCRQACARPRRAASPSPRARARHVVAAASAGRPPVPRRCG